MSVPGPFELLCEFCGYNLRDFKATERCPECGRPIEESIPGNHPGSPWQRRPGPVGYLLTMVLVVARPARVFRSIRSEPQPLPTMWLADAFAVALQAIPGALVVGFGAREIDSFRSVLVVSYVAGVAIAGAIFILTFLWLQVLPWAARLTGLAMGARPIPGQALLVGAHAGTILPLGSALAWALMLAAATTGRLGVAAVLWNLGLLVIPVTLVVSLVLTIRGAYVTRFANRLGSHHSLAS